MVLKCGSQRLLVLMDGAQFHINVKFEFHVSKKGHTLVPTTLVLRPTAHDRIVMGGKKNMVAIPQKKVFSACLLNGKGTSTTFF